ncbi:MAG: carbohydrate kinase [Ruminococcaceae bacterium]|nr:carbohydrate kinase [Oscillospiraceae bacterium]
MAIAGLDIGTTGCKVSVYEPDGRFITSSYREYAARYDNGEQEIEFDAIWEAVQTVIREASSKADHIDALGVASFGEAFALLDENDNTLAPAMLYTDPRGEEECAELVEKLGGEEAVTAITAVKPHAMFSLPKLLWIKKHRPEQYAKAKCLLEPEDFIVYRLTGVRQVDYTLATRVLAFDIRSRSWSKKILEVADVPESLFSTPVPVGTAAGTVKPELAEALGLSADTVIVSCCQDQIAAAAGAGVFTPGLAVDGTGTVECVTPCLPSLPDDPAFYRKGYAVVPGTMPDTYACYSLSFAGGLLLKWFRDRVGKFQAAQSAAAGSDFYADMDKKLPEDPTGILVLTHFTGAASPYMDTGSRGAIVGLAFEHTEEHIYKAFMEGVTYEMLINLEVLEEQGIRVDALRATGGGANSAQWLQIKADILNRPISTLSCKEAGTMGIVLFTGAAIGLYPDLPTAWSKMVHEVKTYYPDPVRAKKYREIYERYRALYGAVRGLV